MRSGGRAIVLAIALSALLSTGCSKRLARTVVDVAVRVAVAAVVDHVAKEHRARRSDARELPPVDYRHTVPMAFYLSPGAQDAEPTLPPYAAPWVARDVQAAVDSIDLASCSQTSMKGRAKIVLEADGRAKRVLIADVAAHPPRALACVSERLLETHVPDTEGKTVTVTVDWSTSKDGD